MMSTPTAQRGLQWLVGQLAERTGLDFDGCHRERMVATVERMWRETGAGSYAAYAELLERDEQAYESLIDRLTIGETYFFREPAHFQLLRQMIAPDWTERAPDGHLRVWSAGCASGEEAYSAAITLAEIGLLVRSRIVGTDLSQQALDRARTAMYSPWSLRRCDEDQRRTWFRPAGRLFELDDRYRDAVQWQVRGLLDAPPAGAFDVVFCRNVLIYLTPAAIAAATETLHDALAPDGWLLLGASDPALEHRGLQRVVGPHGVAYRRATTYRPATIVSSAGPLSHEQRPVSEPSKVARPTPPTTAPRPTRAVARREAARSEQHVGASGIRALGDRGRLEEAAHAADAAIADDPHDAEIRYLAATVHLDAGRPADAVRESAAAVYLDPGLVVAHLVLARAQHATGDRQGSRRSYRNGLDLLGAMPPDAEVPLADGERAGDLVAVVAAQVEASEQGARR